jgi:hypothetical protein
MADEQITDPIRPKATVEIESWARGGTPKVSVRVDDDDPYKAKSLAVDVYLQTVTELEASQESDDEEEDE